MEEAAAAAPPDPPAPKWARSPDYDALNTYSWAWSPADSTDENYTDLAYLVARNSTCKDGHMGCVLVRGVKPGSGGERVGEVAVETECVVGPVDRPVQVARVVRVLPRRGMDLR